MKVKDLLKLLSKPKRYLQSRQKKKSFKGEEWDGSFEMYRASGFTMSKLHIIIDELKLSK